MKCRPAGPCPSPIMAVGEAPGKEEDRLGQPFMGQSGDELTRMLHEAGLLRSEIFLTNVCRYRPPENDIEAWIPKTKKEITWEHVWHVDRYVTREITEGISELEQEIAICKPKVIIAFGNTSLWALTGKWGIRKWRGSLLKRGDAWVIPTYHPAAILRQWDWRFIAMQDLKRAKRQLEAPVLEPSWQFHVRPSFHQVQLELTAWLAKAAEGELKLALDIETRARQIACIGLADSEVRALCIPLMMIGENLGYWQKEEEEWIWAHLKLLLEHPNIRLILQNGSYDAQYLIRQMGIIPRVWWDTMVVHHLMFLMLPKGLDFLSAFYCPWHVYWKDEGKEWDPSMPEEQLWRYNCMDAVRTYEIASRQAPLISTFGLEQQLEERRRSWWTSLYPQVRGTRIDLAARERINLELGSRLAWLEGYISEVLGHPLNPQSPKQMQQLFYGDFNLKPIIHRKRKNVTLDDDALEKLGQQYPLLRPLIAAIALQRTVRVVKSTFIDAPLDADGRARTSYGIAMTDTLRLNSQESVFGSGFNLQNIPSEKSKAIGKAIRRMVWLGEAFEFPNIRSMFVPDPGYIFFDADLDRADLHVVVWEADDRDLKAALRLGVDMHLFACRDIWDADLPVDELVETHPNYPLHRGRWKHKREFAKVGVHATNYGARPPTVAAALGLSIREADTFQKRWFGAHPGIRKWQERVEHQLATSRKVTNAFGYSIIYFDRVEALLGEALAWVPQSTVALVTLMGWTAIAVNEPEIEVLLQVHDSNAGQFPNTLHDVSVAAIRRHMSVVVPYDDPLVIPVGVKTSGKSWGDCR